MRTVDGERRGCLYYLFKSQYLDECVFDNVRFKALLESGIDAEDCNRYTTLMQLCKYSPNFLHCNFAKELINIK